MKTLFGFGSVEELSPEAKAIYDQSYFRLSQKTDMLFAGLLVFEWFLGIVFALTNSPWSWNGLSRSIHPHVYAAVIFGAGLALYPAYMNFRNPGAQINRYVTAVAQMGFSVFFIHLTDGRIETHFHVFGSLAFLAFYRDVKVIVLATVITATDHLLRGIYLPFSVYGVLQSSPWRALEHSAWVLFEDFFLIISMRVGLREMGQVASTQSQIQHTLDGVEQQVRARTRELVSSQELILSQQKQLLSTSKMSALGEMAGGIAHEVNAPVANIKIIAAQLGRALRENQSTETLEMATEIEKSADQVAHIVNGLKIFSQLSTEEKFEKVSLGNLVIQSLGSWGQQIKEEGISLDLKALQYEAEIECHPDEIMKVLSALTKNAIHAVGDRSEKWIRVSSCQQGDVIELLFEDSGPGISEEMSARIFQPFFTTKSVGEGAGLGLSIAASIVRNHGWEIFVDQAKSNTCFVIRIPPPTLKVAVA